MMHKFCFEGGGGSLFWRGVVQVGSGPPKLWSAGRSPTPPPVLAGPGNRA